ncbi:MAG: PAS domain-containing protein [Alphaproteobacteria bacterium]|nr:PAS domain-containing protein [Alphaproteobacteria bacterium]MBF0129615.1 PAS domain-containing protein [Alphaproteobacteria bacterium]
MPLSDDITFPCRRGGPSERRIICSAFAMWEEMRRGAAIPDITEFDPDHFSHLLPYIYILHLSPDVEMSRFLRASPNLNVAIGKEAFGHTVGEAIPVDYRDQFTSYIAGVIMYRKPLTEAGCFFLDGGVEVLHRNIMMPASDRGGLVTHLIGAFSYMNR